ncbi:Pyruvate dehydrogenase E1 component subunit beta [compost metagenome]
MAEQLAKEGISVEVIDLRTISPLDTETLLASVAKTGRAVVVHEATRNFGVGAEISSRIHEALFSQLKAPVGRVGSAFCAVPFSKPLEDAFLPGAKRIEDAIRETLN